MIPLLPFLLGSRSLALAIAGVALFVGGCWPGARQLALGALAVGVAYAAGKLVGSLVCWTRPRWVAAEALPHKTWAAHVRLSDVARLRVQLEATVQAADLPDYIPSGGSCAVATQPPIWRAVDGRRRPSLLTRRWWNRTLSGCVTHEGGGPNQDPGRLGP